MQPWEKSYPAGVSWSQELPPPEPLEDVLKSAVRQWPEQAAIDFYDHKISFRELYDLAVRAAAGFQRLGVGRGTNVALHLPNTPHYVICAFGILLAGGTVVTLSPHVAARDLERQLDDVAAKVLVTTTALNAPSGERGRVIVACSLRDFLPDAAVQALGGRESSPSRELGGLSFAALIANDGDFDPPLRGPLADEVAAIAFTGGTTGTPKGAMLTHANFSSIVNMRKRWLAGSGIDCAGMRSLVVLPISHIYGFSVEMLMGIATGLEMVLHFRFDVKRVLDDIAQKKISFFSGVPTMYSVLVNHSRIGDYDLSSLKVCGVGGAPVSRETAERFRTITGLTLIDGYGLTEMAPMVTMQPLDHPRAGAVGLPAPRTTVAIVDLEDRAREVEPGQIGEICCEGPQLMKGYWNRPQETGAVIEGRRLFTGDVGFLDADGHLHVLDRKKDMVFVGGYNVFPGKVEKAILEHPAVDEAAVIGFPDDYFGHRLKAFITLKPGVQECSSRALEKFLKDKLAAYEIPTEIEIRATLPKTPIGKLAKQELLREELARRQSRAMQAQ